MSQLTIFNKDGAFVADSREVSEMIGIRHSDLLEKIDGYTIHLLNGKFRSAEFFIEGTYQDSTGRTLRKYDLTRKGCDMVANKMTGEKGVLFTASYVIKFEEMEKSQSFDVKGLSPQLQFLIQMEQNVKEIEQRQQQAENQIELIKETFLQRDDNWRQKIKGMLNSAAYRSGKSYRDIRSESYQILESRGKCQLNTRLKNLQDRLADAGATKTKINETNRMDVIESDPRLKEIYTTIVKELSIGTLRSIPPRGA